MAQTNVMPMGPWKVSLCNTCWTLHYPSAQGAERGWDAWLAAELFWFLCTFMASPLCCADHRVRSGVLPGQAHGVHRLLPEHHGVWHGEHPFPEGRVWRVRIQRLRFRGAWVLSLLGFWLDHFHFVLAAGWDTSTPASADSSLSWRRETTPALRPTAAATPTASRGWSPSGPSAVL